MLRFALTALLCLGSAESALSSGDIARVWNEENLAAIRLDRPHPLVQARNLFSVSAAMYDAWAAYDPKAVGFLYRGKHTSPDVAAARHQAISFAAYRVLSERYALSLNASTSLAALDARMAALGYDRTFTSTDTATSAGVGNLVAATISAWFLGDGARQQPQRYADYPASQGGYVPINEPLVTLYPGTDVVNVNRWQRLNIANALDQNGNPIGSVQIYQGAHWLGVRPFALARTDATQPWVNPGPQPQLGGTGDAQFRIEVVEVIRRSSELTPDDGAVLDISPGALGNHRLGTNDGTGHALNPATGYPYAPNVVKRGDFARVLAEFWADGPNSETPPGHWNSIANAVSDHPALTKRAGGTGAVLGDLEWEVKLYFALNAALHDAACAAWSLKRFYEGGRPISFIRFMAGLGQSSNPAAPRYDPNGLPLVPGLIEQVTAATAQAGERHAGLPVDAIAVRAWPGQPIDSVTGHSGVRWIAAVRWLPYQSQTFVTPAFPGYVSGHSTFSRAAAEVLTAITGSPFFPGGMGIYTAPAGKALHFEYGPSETLQLQWATYGDAADQAGLSRLWGGIHVPVDDLTGRRVGAQCGQGAWELARQYFDGSVLREARDLTLRRTDSGATELQWSATRGLFYKVQSTSSLSQPFTDEAGGFTQATDSTMLRTDATAVARKFYRILSAVSPAP